MVTGAVVVVHAGPPQLGESVVEVALTAVCTGGPMATPIPTASTTSRAPKATTVT